MRHNKKFNHLSRTASHRKAMLANMAISLIMHKRITTTLAKAKALKMYVEPLMPTVPEATPVSSSSEPVRATLLMFASSSLLTTMRTWPRLRRQPRRHAAAAVQRVLRVLLPQRQQQLRKQQQPRLLPLKRPRVKLLLKKQRLNNQVKKYISIITLLPVMGRSVFSCVFR